MKSFSNDVFVDPSQNLRESNYLQPKLEIHNLSKTFTNSSANQKYGNRQQQFVVLDRINLDIYPNEFVCIVGASG